MSILSKKSPKIELKDIIQKSDWADIAIIAATTLRFSVTPTPSLVAVLGSIFVGASLTYFKSHYKSNASKPTAPKPESLKKKKVTFDIKGNQELSFDKNRTPEKSIQEGERLNVAWEFGLKSKPKRSKRKSMHSYKHS